MLCKTQQFQNIEDKFKLDFFSHLLKQQIYLSLKNKKSTKKYFYFIVTNRNSTEALSLWAYFCSSSMFKQFIDYSSATENPTSPEGRAANPNRSTW